MQQAYAILSKIVEKKPFFVVTMCTDGEIFDSALDKEKITAPCGNVHMLQCSRHILEPFETAPLYEKMEQQIEAGEVFTALPRCPPAADRCIPTPSAQKDISRMPTCLPGRRTPPGFQVPCTGVFVCWSWVYPLPILR